MVATTTAGKVYDALLLCANKRPELPVPVTRRQSWPLPRVCGRTAGEARGEEMGGRGGGEETEVAKDVLRPHRNSVVFARLAEYQVLSRV